MDDLGAAGIWGAVPLALLREGRPNSQILVYATIASFQGKKDRCWPSREALRERTGLNAATISTAITALAESGWIRKRRRVGTTQEYEALVVLGAETKATNLDHGEEVNQAVMDLGAKVMLPLEQQSMLPLSQRSLEENNKGKQQGKQILTEPSGSLVLSGSKPDDERAKELAARIKAAMKSKTSTEWRNPVKENVAALKVAKWLLKNYPENPEETAKACLGAFWRLIQTRKSEYWKSCPFTPSQLHARGDQVQAVIGAVLSEERARIEAEARSERLRAERNAEKKTYRVVDRNGETLLGGVV